MEKRRAIRRAIRRIAPGLVPSLKKLRGRVFHLLFPLPRQANCTFPPSRRLGAKRGNSYRLLSPSSRADRFGGPSSTRAAHEPARRLGIALWPNCSWTKPLTELGRRPRGARRVAKSL